MFVSLLVFFWNSKWFLLIKSYLIDEFNPLCVYKYAYGEIYWGIYGGDTLLGELISIMFGASYFKEEEHSDIDSWFSFILLSSEESPSLSPYSFPEIWSSF